MAVLPVERNLLIANTAQVERVAVILRRATRVCAVISHRHTQAVTGTIMVTSSLERCRSFVEEAVQMESILLLLIPSFASVELVCSAVTHHVRT